MDKNSVYLKIYNELPELNRSVVDIFVVVFCGVSRYSVAKFLQENLNVKVTQREYDIILKALVKKNLIELDNDKYDAPSELKLELFPELIRQPKYTKVVRNWQKVFRNSFVFSVNEHIRNYLFASFVEGNEFTQISIQKLNGSNNVTVPVLRQMLLMPVYDKPLMHSPQLFYTLLEDYHRFNVQYLKDFDVAIRFFERNVNFEGLYHQVRIQKAEMLFQEGKLDEAYDLISNINNTGALLLKSHIELFQGRFAQSVASFDKARVTDKEGLKMSRIEFDPYHEFLYWINFVFYPEGLDLKKLDTAIKRKEKGWDEFEKLLLPLLFFIRKNRTVAEARLKSIQEQQLLVPQSIKTFFYLVLTYLINGELSNKNTSLYQLLSFSLQDGKRWLLLRELNNIVEKSAIESNIPKKMLNNVPDDLPCLMDRLTIKEKWEQLLDELIILTKGRVEQTKKEAADSRICYLLNLENRYLQPILQTMTAKGSWSAGRNIALKRFKEQLVDGLTEQDRRVAGTITYTSHYYGAVDYYLDFNKAIVELCGHPLLFLYANPNVSVELIKSQPEIITERLKNGIRLKTNITDPEQRILLVKETQTRYKVVSLSVEQQAIVRTINQGITIPVKGKSKLIETVSNLSGVMTIHSDIEEGVKAVKAVVADSRIRVQIVPLGDGLKAELFVKPLGTEPPYVKPGRGSKVIYGTVNGEKCQAIRNMDDENSAAEKLNGAVALALDADMIEDAATFSDPYDCLNLLEIINQHSDIAIIEWPEGERFKIKKSVSLANLHLRAKGKGQWFELDGELNVDENTVLNLKELISLTRKSKGRFVELNSGEFLALTEELRRHIDELQSFVSIDKNGLTINRFASHAIEEITNNAASFKADKSWKDFQKRIKETEKADAIVPITLDAELRPYQEEGFLWMSRLNTWGAGACLADDMGLGKTVQAIAMMLYLAEKGPLLVVCPASVVLNWGNELQKFAPTLNPVILKQGNRADTFSALAAFDVLVITYGLLQTEEERISKINWAMAVLDEAHAIKNTQTKSSKAAMNIQADFKLALTGTPIQNHLGELWNLFNFCNPGLLGTLPQFTDRYVKNDEPAQKNHLKKLITPFILRRTKNKVLDELPAKTEITHSVELSDNEMAFYEALRREAIDTIENNDGPNGQQHLQALAEITKLRLACCNTALVNKEIQLPSAKLEAFMEIIEELRANKHRALVFSQFVGHLSIVRKALDKQGITYQYLDGSTSISDRQNEVKAFQSGKGDLFLISLRAGGLGLNLTAADYVLHLDPWWNPAIEDQASDRAHRIGQSRPVTIYRLVAKNTIEEKIVQLHATKRDLADSLLEGTDQSARLSTVDLLNLLKEV